MEINVKLLLIWISFTITTVQQQTVTDPCPNYAPSISIANMCQSGLGKEDDRTGENRVDSVALRITTRQENCFCQVYLQNQNDKYEVIMQKYDGRTMAAPNNSDCGLAINISLSSKADRDNIPTTVECNNGTSFRPIMLEINEKLNFKSTLDEGSFERGYCLQIFRKNAQTEYPSLQVACSQATTNKTSNKQTITEYALSTQYVIIGACTGAIVLVITLAVVFMYTRRKRKNDSVIDSNNKEPTQIKSDNDAGYDSEGLKRNILYQTSEQCDITDYHTVELEERPVVNNTQNIDGDYISIDENFGTNRKTTPNLGIQPKCKTQITKENLNNKIEHVTPGTVNNVEYAVVNRRDRLAENTEHATAPSTEYAVINKSGRLGKNIKHVTPENGNNVEYAVVDKITQI